jgi:predicted lipoprotein with Yx(FWY)xxD motif
VRRPAWTIVAAAVAAVTLAVLAIVLLTRPGTRAKRADATGDAASGPTLGVETTRLGRILVDARGRTLYLFAKDRGRHSACVGGCTRVWPPALATGRVDVGPGLKTSKVTTVGRGDGGRQLVYNGHPLYTLISDTAPGQASGQGFEGTWFVVSPAGRAIVPPGAKAAAGY